MIARWSYGNGGRCSVVDTVTANLERESSESALHE